MALRPGVGRIVWCPGQTAASTLISNDPQRTQPKAKGKEQSDSQTKPRPLERACPLHSLRCCASTTPDLMEAAVATTSSLVLFSSTPRRSLTSFKTSPSLLQPSCSSCSVPSARQQHPVCLDVPRLPSSKKKNSILRCSSSLADGPSTLGSSVRWVLDPAGLLQPNIIDSSILSVTLPSSMSCPSAI